MEPRRVYADPVDHRPDSDLPRRLKRDGVLYERFPTHDWGALSNRRRNVNYRCRACGLISGYKLLASRWTCLRPYTLVWPPLDHDAQAGIAVGLFGPSTAEELASVDLKQIAWVEYGWGMKVYQPDGRTTDYFIPEELAQ